jgi:two-component system, cell cycle response regulator
LKKVGINKKVYSIIALVLVFLSISVSILVAYHIKEYGILKSKESGTILARSVRDGLTTHMIHNIMDERFIYLENITKDQKIENIRVVRSNSVAQQYGKGIKGETLYDELEVEVLNSGIEKTKLIKKDESDYLRVTIPYTATATANPNCITCHTGNVGEVLGAISMEINIDDVIKESEGIVFKIVGFILFVAIMCLFIANYYIKPYIKLFNDLEEGIQKAYHGNFDYHIKTKLENEAGVVANRLNDLSSIFLFKKTIESDLSKDIIYQRIDHILKTKFDLKHTALFETCSLEKSETRVYGSKDDEAKLEKFISSNDCRASRLDDIVVSSEFANICDNCIVRKCEYICIPFRLGNQKTLIVNIEFDTKDELNNFKGLVPIVSNYIETAKPVLESKILLEKLEEKALKDPLTGLYNRRHLEKFINSNLNNKGFEYSSLMIDIDYFKMINDTYGHDVGDRVLKILAEVLIRNIKGSDVACRYGGEEFIVILVDATKQIALKIADNIRKDFERQKFESKGEVFSKTLSVGVATYKIDASNHWQTIKCADEALYFAKNSGRNKVCEFSANMHQGQKEIY